MISSVVLVVTVAAAIFSAATIRETSAFSCEPTKRHPGQSQGRGLRMKKATTTSTTSLNYWKNDTSPSLINNGNNNNNFQNPEETTRTFATDNDSRLKSHWNNHCNEKDDSGSATASTKSTTTATTTTTLGDIMGLVTESEGLAAHYGIHHPLDRMALTANGNLQRLVSSYYDAPVSVVVDYCYCQEELEQEQEQAKEEEEEGNSNDATTTATTTTAAPPPATITSRPRRRPLRTWDRRVSLQVFDITFCVATSEIRVYDPQCLEWVESGKVGLGQLFRQLNVLPTFCLQRAGKTTTSTGGASKKEKEKGETKTKRPLMDTGTTTTNGELASSSGGGGGFWREYTLECAQLSCAIHETFIEGLWDLPSAIDNNNKSSDSSRQ